MKNDTEEITLRQGFENSTARTAESAKKQLICSPTLNPMAGCGLYLFPGKFDNNVYYMRTTAATGYCLVESAHLVATFTAWMAFTQQVISASLSNNKSEQKAKLAR